MALKKTSALLPVAAAPKSTSKSIAGIGHEKTVDLYFEASAAFDAAEANLKTAKLELTESAYEVWLKNRGVANNVIYAGSTGKEVRITMKDHYSAMPDTAEPQIESIIGEANMERLFSYDETIKVDVSAIEEEKREAFVLHVKELARAMGIPESVMEMGRLIRPIKDTFHTQRHALLTEAQNRELQPVVKTVISVAAVTKKGN